MKEKKNKKKSPLEGIWSEKFWNKEAERIELEYAELLSDSLPETKAPADVKETEHRIEKFVRNLIHKTGKGSLHVGLTSSDLEDNIRILREYKSCKYLYDRLRDFWFVFEKSIKEDKTTFIVARTHLLPAGFITVEERFRPIIDTAYSAMSRPQFFFKGIGGSLGTRHVQKYLNITDEDLDRIFAHNHIRIQDSRSQTGNHLTEMDIANWLSTQAMIFAKLANDVRQMFAFGEAINDSKDVASTAIVQKQFPNPWRWERVSGMAEEIYNLPSLVTRISSSCLLERTLNNQSVLNHSLKNAFEVLEMMLDDAEVALSTLVFTGYDEVMEKNPEIRMIDLMIETGVNREDAYASIREEESSYGNGRI